MGSVGSPQVTGNEPDDDFDALVGGMGGDDGEGGVSSTPSSNVQTGGQPRQPNVQQSPNQPNRPPVQPSGPNQGGQQGTTQPVDPQVALHRLSQYETTLIPQLQRRLQEAETKATQLQQTEQGVRQYTELMTQYGLKPDEAQIGLQMAAAYRRSPAEFLKSLINTTRANGVDLSGLGVQPGLDPNALNLVLDNKLKPILEWFNQNQQQSELERQAQEDLNQFFTQFPDAVMHQDDIAVLMERMNLDNRDAYYQLKMWAMQNQYDWNQPLVPQIEARKAGAQPQQGNGRGFPATRNSNTYHQPVTQQDNEQFDVNTSWKDIVRGALPSLG
jgi:hypothetical protein